MSKANGAFGKITGVSTVRQTENLDLHDFNEDYDKGSVFEVWVSLTRAHVQSWSDLFEDIRVQEKALTAKKAELQQEHLALIEDLKQDIDGMADANEKHVEMCAELDRQATEELTQGYEEKTLKWYSETWLNFNLDEARQIKDHLKEHNPAAWDWVTQQTHNLIGAFRQRALKK